LSLSRYFQDELDHLRRSGDAFAQRFPGLTKYLSSRATDPDVERMMEGFAFLTARLREKIDDQLPEVTQSLLMLLWPNFLRPVPSMCIMQLDPIPGAISEVQTVPAGAEVHSIPVDGTVCRFRTACRAEIVPMAVEMVRHDVSRAASVVTLRLRTLDEQPVTDLNLRVLRLFLGGASYSAQTLNLWMHRYMRKATMGTEGFMLGLDAEAIRPVGIDRDDAVLPYPDNAFMGYRLLQEFYTIPEKFSFFDIDVPSLRFLPARTKELTFVFEFERPLPPDVRIEASSFQLNCTPAINLFKHSSEPIRLDGRRTEYALLPARIEGSELEIFEIEEVNGWLPAPDGRSNGISRTYARFESFSHEMERADDRHAVYFREKVSQGFAGADLTRTLSFIREDEALENRTDETISVSLECTNGVAPTHLGIGDLNRPMRNLPSFVTPRNLTRPSPPCYPLVDGSLQWQLISALSLNYLSLQDAPALRNILMAFDFPARTNMQRERGAKLRLEGIETIASERVDRLFKGLPVRGMRTHIGMRESHFESEGEMFLFASVLAEFFALYATVNSFHELLVQGVERGEVYRWQPRIGNQPLL